MHGKPYGIWYAIVAWSSLHNRWKPGNESPQRSQPISDRKRTKQATWYQCAWPAWPDCISSSWSWSWLLFSSGTNRIIRISPLLNGCEHALHETRTTFVYSIEKSCRTVVSASGSFPMSSMPLEETEFSWLVVDAKWDRIKIQNQISFNAIAIEINLMLFWWPLGRRNATMKIHRKRLRFRVSEF